MEEEASPMTPYLTQFAVRTVAYLRFFPQPHSDKIPIKICHVSEILLLLAYRLWDLFYLNTEKNLLDPTSN